MTFLTILPLSFVMIAGPQILSAVFLATSEDWGANSLSFVTCGRLDHRSRHDRVLCAGRRIQLGTIERHALHRRPGPARARGAAHLPDQEDGKAAEVDGKP